MFLLSIIIAFAHVLFVKLLEWVELVCVVFGWRAVKIVGVGWDVVTLDSNIVMPMPAVSK